MSARDAARARWRADLHEFGAAALDSAGLADMANKSTIQAVSLREYADLMDELAAAKAAYDPEVSASVAVLRDVKQRVIAFRAAERTFGGPRIGVIDNIAEPSDDELTALGY